MKLGSGFGVTYGVMATQAAHFPASGVAPSVDSLHNVGVATAAGVFGYIAAGIADLDGVWKISGSEVERVKETVAGFDGVLAGKIMRSMAIVTGGCVLVASLDPAIVLRIHHMAVGAGLRIVGEIGITLGVNKCITAKANHRSHENSKQQCDRDGSIHRPFLKGKISECWIPMLA
jgi:hypothetical protein